VRPFLLMDADDKRVIEQINTRAVAKRMVDHGPAEWIPNKRALRLIDQREPARQWLALQSGANGPKVMQRIRM